MNFNYSQKTDPETGDVKIIIEGDKEFVASFTTIKKVYTKAVIDAVKEAIKLKHKQSAKVVEMTGYELWRKWSKIGNPDKLVCTSTSKQDIESVKTALERLTGLCNYYIKNK